MKLPEIIEKAILGFKLKEVMYGCTAARVFKCFNSQKTFYLKIEEINEESTREQNIYHFLAQTDLVPEVIASTSDSKYNYLLLSCAEGLMSCDKELLKDPKRVVKMLAKGILTLQEIDISNCPYESTLNHKLELAKKRIEEGLVDIENSEDSEDFTSPKEIYNFLVNNKPKEELSFIHGDYCLPNIFVSGKKVTFIDLGRAGIGDIYQDIALCVRSLRHNFKTDEYTPLLFKYLNIVPNFDKIRYYILLDELF